jgi:hypothetical protein
VTLIGETAETRFPLFTDLSKSLPWLPAFFRVVAVDANGARSDSSAFAELPHPLIVAPDEIAVRPGEAFSLQLHCTRSLGRYLSNTTTEAAYHMKFWEAESIEFTGLLPDWLTLDSDSGMITGKIPEHFASSITIDVTAAAIVGDDEAGHDSKRIGLAPKQ